jgi:SAM-dependent methyltransferase
LKPQASSGPVGPAGLDPERYAASVEAESKKWGAHLQLEAAGTMLAWLDHPLIREHYQSRALVDDQSWDEWLPGALGGPAEHSLHLGCGSALRSIKLWEMGVARSIDGLDVSTDRVHEAEKQRAAVGGAPGRFWVEDVNTATLPAGKYDLVFADHSLHHFLALERVMEQVAQALTPRGLFVLEEFVGPTQFQWTERQMGLVAALLATLPERLRVLPWGAVKHREDRPAVADVVATSPFESIRSAEIVPIFDRFFSSVVVRNLGGTLQHLLYNGIAHCFWPLTPDSERFLRAIIQVEDSLVDAGLLDSDFKLLVGRPR